MSTVVRTDLTREEYAEIRKLAIDRHENVSAVVGAKLRELIKPKRKGRA